MLVALQAHAQLALGKPEDALGSVAAGLKAVEKMGGAPLKAELHRFRGEAETAMPRHRRRAPAERKVLGIARRDEPRPPAPTAGQARRGGGTARPDPRLVRGRHP